MHETNILGIASLVLNCAGQVLSGSSFAYNSTYFFEQVGLSTSITYKLNLGGTGLALFVTFVNCFS
jgi:MFS transporter, SP family, general alpha glucoside:H+ symporter